MRVQKCQSDWETFARLDAKWAILTRSEKKFNQWNDEDFFATGTQEIQEFLNQSKNLGIELVFSEALDFGCGMGRLTRGLAQHFDKVCGIDISQEMVSLARDIHKDNNRIEFIHNPQTDLSCLENNRFDLVYSMITLQHVPDRKTIRNYLLEFIRILKPGGLLYFQLPTVRDYRQLHSTLLRLRGWVFHLMVKLGVSPEFCFSRLRLAPYMHMSYIPSNEIKKLFSQEATILHVENDNQTNTSYFIEK